MDMADPRRPGEYQASRPVTGAQTATPHNPPGGFATMAAEVSAIEHLITEALVAQERRLMLRLETASKAAESAELTMARKRARRNGGLATALGVAAGTMAVVFSTAWGVFREYRQAAEVVAVEVAAEAVEAKATPLEERVAANERTSADTAKVVRDLVVDVQAVADSIQALRNDLEAPTKVSVPQSRKRPR